jgi:hypothetical protein
MRRDFFTFAPEFKLFIAGNHKPAQRGVDEAIRRRFHLVPFTVTISEPDKELPDKLRAEWPGMLQWAINGCLEWQRTGLDPPPCVTAATDAYLEAEDSLGQWLAECCTIGDPTRYRADNNAAFGSWQTWCATAGEPAGNRKTLFEQLEGRGFKRFSSHGNADLSGLPSSSKTNQMHIGTAEPGRVHLGAPNSVLSVARANAVYRQTCSQVHPWWSRRGSTSGADDPSAGRAEQIDRMNKRSGAPACRADRSDLSGQLIAQRAGV